MPGGEERGGIGAGGFAAVVVGLALYAAEGRPPDGVRGVWIALVAGAVAGRSGPAALLGLVSGIVVAASDPALRRALPALGEAGARAASFPTLVALGGALAATVAAGTVAGWLASRGEPPVAQDEAPGPRPERVPRLPAALVDPGTRLARLARRDPRAAARLADRLGLARTAHDGYLAAGERGAAHAALVRAGLVPDGRSAARAAEGAAAPAAPLFEIDDDEPGRAGPEGGAS